MNQLRVAQKMANMNLGAAHIRADSGRERGRGVAQRLLAAVDRHSNSHGQMEHRQRWSEDAVFEVMVVRRESGF